MKKNRNPYLFILSVLLLEIVCVCGAENVKKSVDNFKIDNGGDDVENDDAKDVAMEIPDIDPENKTAVSSCSARRSNNKMHAILYASQKQFPFMASLISLSDEHVCSGSLVSNGLVLTTATCAKKQISTVLLNTIKASTDSKDVVKMSVIKSETFPSYTGEESLNNVAVIYTNRHNGTVGSKIRISNYSSAKNLGSFEVLGYGLNWEVGVERKLQYVGLENRFEHEPGNTINGYIDCVEAKEPTCLRDTGGPAISGNELIGIVVKGQPECTKEMSDSYAINKLMATILPAYNFKAWLDEIIKKNEEQSQVVLATYPSKLVGVRPDLRQGDNSGAGLGISFDCIILTSVFSLYFH